MSQTVRSDAPGMPLNIHLYVTPRCNLECVHCYYDAWSRGPHPHLLSVNEIGDLVNLLCKNYDADFHMEGGEMFLRKDLDGLERVVPKENWHRLTFTTNGLAPINLSKAFLAGIGDLRVSVEGHRDSDQRTLRGTDLAPVLKTCDSLLRDSIPITLRITLFRDNISHFGDIVDFYTKLGFSRLSFFEFQASGRGKRHLEQLALEDGQFESFLDSLSLYRFPTGLSEFKLSLNPSRAQSVERVAQALQVGGYAIRKIGHVPSLTINWNGDVGVSPWLATANTLLDRFGNIEELSILDDIRKRYNLGQLVPACGHYSELSVSYRPSHCT